MSADSRSAARLYLRSRLAAALAILPLGVWTVLHLWHNLAVFAGPRAWQTAVTGYASPLTQALTYVVVLAPLLVHLVWGLVRIRRARVNNLAYGTYANLKFFLQRLSALGVLAFLGAHLWLALIQPRVVGGHAEPMADLAHEMHFHTPTLVVYVLGTLGVSYHLANGLQTFGMKTGLSWPRSFTDRRERPYLLVFLVLLAMSWGAIYGLWRAGAGGAPASTGVINLGPLLSGAPRSTA
jgi:succinate dehydrogenase / fumarate reductase cytochrome b subunit